MTIIDPNGAPEAEAKSFAEGVASCVTATGVMSEALAKLENIDRQAAEQITRVISKDLGVELNPNEEVDTSYARSYFLQNCIKTKAQRE